jgi:hypothetical protein
MRKIRLKTSIAGRRVPSTAHTLPCCSEYRIHLKFQHLYYPSRTGRQQGDARSEKSPQSASPDSGPNP